MGRGAALITTLGCTLWVGSLDGDERLVASPIAVLLVLAAWMVGVLRDRDGELPVFELGAITTLITLLYAAIPLAQFLAGGLHWGPLSSAKLQELQTDPATVAGLGWRHVTYLGSFVLSYLLVRGRRKIPRVDLKWPDSTSLWLAVSVYVGSVAFLFAVGSIYGVEFDPSYKNLVDTPEVRWAQMPYVLQQLFQTVGFIQQVAKLALLLMLFKRLEAAVGAAAHSRAARRRISERSHLARRPPGHRTTRTRRHTALPPSREAIRRLRHRRRARRRRGCPSCCTASLETHC